MKDIIAWIIIALALLQLLSPWQVSFSDSMAMNAFLLAKALCWTIPALYGSMRIRNFLGKSGTPLQGDWFVHEANPYCSLLGLARFKNGEVLDEK